MDDEIDLLRPHLLFLQQCYRGAILHGGISPEEVIVRVATLRSRSR